MLAFLDTNMLVSPPQNSRVGGLEQHKAPTREFCIAIEYRLKDRQGSVIRHMHSQLYGRYIPIAYMLLKTIFFYIQWCMCHFDRPGMIESVNSK